MTMADKIVVLNKGNIEQVGSPLDLYHHPRNRFVAGFIGSPKMNFLGGGIAAANGCETIGIRPEHIDIVAPSQGGAAHDESLQGAAVISEHLGSDTFIHIRLTSGETVTVRQPGNVQITAGDALLLRPNKAHLHRFDANGVAIGTN